MKRYSIAFALLVTSLCITAQVTNNAIDFDRNGRLSLGVIDNNTATSGTTLQLWMSPYHWIPGANIASWGSDLNMQLGTLGEIVIKSNGDTLSFTDANLTTGNWAHITLLLNGKDISLLVNNTNEQSSTLAKAFTPPTTEPLILGGGFLGRIDEVRVWNTILPADYNRFWNNTIDSFNPQWAFMEYIQRQKMKMKERMYFFRHRPWK